VIGTRLGLFSTLAHAAIMALLFGSLALLTRRVLVGASVARGGPHATPFATSADREISAPHAPPGRESLVH
jgi:hypothetical protein